MTSQNAILDHVGSFINSSLLLEKGAKLTAQSGIFTNNTMEIKENASLTLTGDTFCRKAGVLFTCDLDYRRNSSQ